MPLEPPLLSKRTSLALPAQPREPLNIINYELPLHKY